MKLLLVFVAMVLPTLPLFAEGMFYRATARASEIDSRTREYPEIDFTFSKAGKPSDTQLACVDTRVPSSGFLVIWLMAPSEQLFDRLASYGHHAIQVTYPREWFARMDAIRPASETRFFSEIRLEAATGRDHSPFIQIEKPDGLAERSLQFVKYLAKEHPEGNWSQFLSQDGLKLDWEKVILSGSSHGSTTAARLAKEVKVARVVMFSGPRDQTETWQSLPSATPPERFFGFTHVLDMGWKNHHYCRSWLMLGLNKYGPVVDVDTAKPPYESTRRLISHADVKNNPSRAHGASTPGGNSPKSVDGEFLYEDVWKYLFTHPTTDAGNPVPIEPGCKDDF
ncbi:BPSS1187 family protein [Luteolibacter algae]|uniref:BPSS1187 family protein n=1 Tax=Luteolibacter algae TaxID=454151 RepID=A0ABW5DDP0_9BACT